MLFEIICMYSNLFLNFLVALIRADFRRPNDISIDLLGGGVFGYSLGSFGDGVFSQFSWEEEPDGSLDFPGGDG